MPDDLTPVEKLAAELEAEAGSPSDSPHAAWRSMLLRDFAELLRDQLAPKWTALAGERDLIRDQLETTRHHLGVRRAESDARAAERDDYRTQLTAALDGNRRLAADLEAAIREGDRLRGDVGGLEEENERLHHALDTAEDALRRIHRGLTSGEGQPLTDEDIIAIASAVTGGDDGS